uniref:Aromatic amino acid beta-eliminating lyase/threonine aldolase domain-containing protein n=1 Tax=Oryza glaberrima TaxID=4538 RepID=I1PZC9_ORYGL
MPSSATCSCGNRVRLPKQTYTTDRVGFALSHASARGVRDGARFPAASALQDIVADAVDEADAELGRRCGSPREDAVEHHGPRRRQVYAAGGLGAPVGSVIVGSTAFMGCNDGNMDFQAKILRKTLGGGMRQMGFLCAAAYVVVRDTVEKLADDLPPPPPSAA